MSSAPSWYVHFQDETLGPLASEKIIAMLAQNRIQFADFAWRSGLTKWVRIGELDDFAAYLPTYPRIGIPEETTRTASKPMPTPTPTAKAKPSTATRFLRIPISGRVITAEHGEFEMLNIAERGVFVAAAEPLEVGTELQFSLDSREFPESLQKMRGVVIRHAVEQDQKGFAIEFIRLNPIHKNFIEQYVRKRSE